MGRVKAAFHVTRNLYAHGSEGIVPLLAKALGKEMRLKFGVWGGKMSGFSVYGFWRY